MDVVFDREADELDIIILTDQPVPAVSVPVAEDIYARVDPETGALVGLMITNYRTLATYGGGLP